MWMAPNFAPGGNYGWNIETTVPDMKKVVGAGRQQVRFLWASIGAFHLCLRTDKMTEAWAWGRLEEEELVDRAASPWDDPAQRPSHAGKRRPWRRELLAEEIRAVAAPRSPRPKSRRSLSVDSAWPLESLDYRGKYG